MYISYSEFYRVPKCGSWTHYCQGLTRLSLVESTLWVRVIQNAAVHLKYLGVCLWSSSDFLSGLNNENVTIISAPSEPDSPD